MELGTKLRILLELEDISVLAQRKKQIFTVMGIGMGLTIPIIVTPFYSSVLAYNMLDPDNIN